MVPIERIRNFSIIAHIDHGKSTLADRLLEATQTIPERKMREQVLDSMELERERGITIKMQPVRMRYTRNGVEYELNLIDTPGHIDFSYEVSRALRAVEGVILLVDATQGVQAQTLSVLHLAQRLGLTIIPVINKIDLPLARVEETRAEIVTLIGCQPEDVLAVSGKTGAGVDALLETVVAQVPPPQVEFPGTGEVRALVFDFEYSVHLGVLVYIRVFDGELRRGDALTFAAAGERCGAIEVGVFAPAKEKIERLGPGEIGYIVTGIKQPGRATVGDTIVRPGGTLPAIPGYETPRPVVWASIYPESQDDFNTLRQALERLHLSDASFSYDEEAAGALGRGYRVGCLGMLHLEIITERLRREYALRLVIATPTIAYTITDERNATTEVYSPAQFPVDLKGLTVLEPWVAVTIITPPEYAGGIIQLFYEHEATVTGTTLFSDNRTELVVAMPLRELMRHFFDELKSISSGFASLSYEFLPTRPADVVRLDILVNGDIVPAFSRITARRRVEREAVELVEKLEATMPRQLIVIKLQAQALGRIIAARTISALRKDVTDYLYGGDITRKMKLREKQKKGKKKMQRFGRVDIPPDVFLKMMRGTND